MKKIISSSIDWDKSALKLESDDPPASTNRLPSQRESKGSKLTMKVVAAIIATATTASAFAPASFGVRST